MFVQIVNKGPLKIEMLVCILKLHFILMHNNPAFSAIIKLEFSHPSMNVCNNCMHILEQDGMINLQLIQIKMAENKEKLDELTLYNTKLQRKISKLEVSVR